MVKKTKKVWKESPLKKTPYSVVDVEINNNIDKGNGEWAYGESNIVLLGIITEDKITQIIKEKNDTDDTYAKAIWSELQANLDKGKILCSFNWRMEHGSINALLQIINQRVGHIQEIKPFKARGWGLGRFYNELRQSSEKTPNVPDPLEFQANKCIEYWNIPQKKELVIEHNIADLKREAIVLTNREVLKKNKTIDVNGWLRE